MTLVKLAIVMISLTIKPLPNVSSPSHLKLTPLKMVVVGGGSLGFEPLTSCNPILLFYKMLLTMFSHFREDFSQISPKLVCA